MTNERQQQERDTAKIFLYLTIVVFIIFVARFVQVMLLKQAHGQDLSKSVATLYARSSIIAAKRGAIYDVNGNPLAMNATSYSIYAVLPNDFNVPAVEDKETTAAKLSAALGMDRETVYDLLNLPDRVQVEFGSAGRNLSVVKKNEIEALGLQGIYFNETQTRLYPNGIFSSQLIGLAQASTEEGASSELNGIMGIEQQFNTELAGSPGETQYEETHTGYKIPGTERVVKEAVQGQNVYTTIESRLQTYLETLVTNLDKKHQPESLMVLVVDPKTGAIVAATQRPTFNATDKEGIDKAWDNLLVSQSYEPGSVFKTFTLAAATNENQFNPQATFRSGSIVVEDSTIKDWNEVGWGEISYLEGFARSSNVAFVRLMRDMGSQKWKSYIDAFGFTKSTDSGLADEVAGGTLYDNPVTRANTAFGQGISVTPFQMVQAYTAIANNGQMVKLRYIDRFENIVSGESVYQQPQVIGQPITAETAQKVLTYMEDVVTKTYGTGTMYKIPGVRVGAKTGTAQVVDPTTGKYYANSYLYSAAVIAPLDNPKYVVYIAMRRPKVMGDGNIQNSLSEVVTPFLKRALAYTPAEANPQGADHILPHVVGQAIEPAKRQLAEKEFGLVEIVGEGTTVLDQLPAANTAQAPRNRIFLLTEGTIKMPNMTGWSQGDVARFSSLTKREITTEGEGFVSSQSVPAGTILQADTPVSVTLTPQVPSGQSTSESQSSESNR